MADLSGKKILMVVAPRNFRDEEFKQPKEILVDQGGQIVVTAKGVEEAKGMLGAVVPVNKKLAQIKVDNYDALIFVGGTGASTYFDDPDAQALAKQAVEKNKVVGAICIGPSILANAQVLKGKQATAFPSEAENLRAHGVVYTGEPVTVDGLIVTAKGPEAASEFGQKIAQVLSAD